MKSTRTLTIVIAISVVINLLLIGFFVGQRLPRWAGPMFGDAPHMVQMRQMDRARGMPIGANDLNIFAAMRSLDPQARKAAQAAFQQADGGGVLSLAAGIGSNLVLLPNAQPCEVRRILYL